MKCRWFTAVQIWGAVLFVMSMAPASFGTSPIFPTEEETYLSERIKVKDWPAIRLYLEQAEQSGKEPLYADILSPLVGSSYDEFVWELIDKGILEKVHPAHFTNLLATAIADKHASLGRTLLDHALAREWPSSTRDLLVVLLLTIDSSPELIDLALATGVDLNHSDYPVHPLLYVLNSYPRRMTSRSYVDELELARAPTPQQRAELFWTLIDRGADIDIALKRHGNSVSSAGIPGDVRILDYLLAHGGDINKSGDSALRISILYGANHKEFIPVLLERGIDVCLESSDGETAYDAALSIGAFDVISEFPELFCKEKVHLAYAGITGDLEIMQFLLEQGADVNEPLNGNTALGYAVGSDNAIAAIPFLLEHGADICWKNHGGRTPYSMALEYPGYTAILRQFPQLLCKSDIRFNDAVNLGDLVIMDYMLQQGADINRARGGDVPLTDALLGFDPEATVPWLLERGADVCGRGDLGITPWERALFSMAFRSLPSDADTPLLRVLKKTPDLRCPGTTGFEYAVGIGDVEWLELMIAQGMDVNAPNSLGALPLMQAFDTMQTIPLVKVLLAHGADTCARNANGVTAYDMAAQLYKGETRNQLLPLLECQE